MTIAEIKEKLSLERGFGSRYPARIIFVENLDDYSALEHQLKGICDVTINVADFCRAPDTVPQFDQIKNKLKECEGQQVLLLSVGEYLRLCTKRELNPDRRQFRAFWETQQPEASKTRVIIPVFNCRDIFDRIIGAIGFLYVRKGIELLPYADGGAQESAHRAGTENVASIVGMATALKENCDFLKQHQQHILELENTLIAGLNGAGISYCRNGRGTTLPGLISLSFLGKDGEAILHRMDLMGISISTGSACDSVNTETSHVLQAIRLDDNYAKGTIRVSLGKNNTKEDAEKIAAALVKIVG